MVVKVVSLVEPRIDRVWVLVDQAVAGGRSSTTEVIGSAAPRFAVRVVGHTPLVPSQ